MYTDFDFVEYDQPHDWGMADFCLSCGECAKACPSGALPQVDSPNSGFGYEPSYEFSDEPGDAGPRSRFDGEGTPGFWVW